MDTGKDKVCLEVRNIRIHFGQVQVLRDVNLAIRETEIVSIIGPNGAGKSTLFNIICGLTRPSGGRVLYRGEDITNWPPHRICHAGIGRTFQIARPFAGMTTLENVILGLCFGKPEGGKWSLLRHEALRLLDLMQLSQKADTPARELTVSELRRLEAARVLATRPRFLLLDEIAAGFSPQVIEQWVELLKKLRDQGITLLIIDHFLSLTAKVSDRLIALTHGTVTADGEPAAVLACPEVVAAYFGEGRQAYQE